MEDKLKKLFKYVKEKRLLDFSAYRESTVRRRLQLRLSATGASDYASYLACLSERPDEMNALIDALLIKVSNFFRNPLVFENLLSIVLPGLIKACKGDVLKIWCAGCAQGEEAYSVAMLIKELMRNESVAPRTFIIGTDIDRAAIEDARKAEYRPESLGEVKKAYLDRYFTVQGGVYKVTEEIRSMVTFAYHDVTACTTPKEGVFSDYHLILCRNVLIYFDRELSERVLSCLSGHIPGNGYMVLGEAESLPPQILGEYEEVAQATKIFGKKS